MEGSDVVCTSSLAAKTSRTSPRRKRTCKFEKTAHIFKFKRRDKWDLNEEVQIVYKIRFCGSKWVRCNPKQQTKLTNIQPFLFFPITIIALPTSTMSGRPVRKAVAEREPTNTLLAVTSCQTPAQVKQDKARAAATALAAQHAITVAKSKQLSHVADLEDQVSQNEQKREEHANRPDLQPSKAVKKKVIIKFIVAYADLFLSIGYSICRRSWRGCGHQSQVFSAC